MSIWLELKILKWNQWKEIKDKVFGFEVHLSYV